MFEKLAEKIMRYPKHVIALWIIVLLIASPFAYMVLSDPAKALTYGETGAGTTTESIQGSEILSDVNYFGNGNGDAAMIVVIEYDDDAQKTSATQFAALLATAVPLRYSTTEGEKAVATVIGPYSSTGVGGVFLVSVSFPEAYDPSSEVQSLRDLVSDTKTDTINPTTYVTGSAAIYHDTEASSMEDVKRIDPVTILLILVLIGLFFRSVISATTPPIVIGFAYAITLMVMLGLAQIMSIYYITSTLVLVSMLGAGCDYCIFIMARYREERKSGKDHHDSLKESIVWAGESITISGCAVIIGFGAMSICSYEMISSMGTVMALGIVFALLAALTLIPAVIAVIGDRIFWPSKVETYKEGSKAMRGSYGKMSRLGARYFKASSAFALRHAGAIVAAALLITVPMAYVATTHTSSYDSIAVMSDSESKSGVNSIVENADGGILMPTYVVIEANHNVAELLPFDMPDGLVTLGVLNWNSDQNYGSKYRIETETMGVNLQSKSDNVGAVLGLLHWSEIRANWSEIQKPFPEAVVNSVNQIAYISENDPVEWDNLVGFAAMQGVNIDNADQVIDYILNYKMGTLSSSHDGRQYIKMTVMLEDVPTSDRSMSTIGEIRSIIAEDKDPELIGATYVTGATALTYDVSQVVSDEFFLIEVLVMTLIFILLFFVMKSYLTPLRAILTIVMSIVWTLGLTHLLFAGVLGIPVYWILPIVLFVVCLGLGMDYDILLTTRIRENVSKGMSNDDAIVHALESTGAVITICGIIMSSAFGTMMLSSSPMLQQFGFALWFAILVDALLVRTYLVPAVMHLLGRWNWVGPKWMQKGEYDHIHEETE
ncbi:MAG: MMPL family transporter [Candidatus Methanomethylophilaceae archaeon]|nr:MMPL family transporter [Candidatus Methanomethylophilaceae archaeon]